MIYIGLQRSSSPLSWIVRWFTWSKYSHAGVVVDTSGSLDPARPKDMDLYEAHEFHGVRKRKLKGKWDLFSVEGVTREKQAQVLDFFRKQSGKPYDWSAIFGFIFRTNWDKEDKWFCSEIIVRAFYKADLPLLRTNNFNRITPRDIQLSPRIRFYATVDTKE